MRQTDVVGRLAQGELLPQASFPFAERVHPTADGGHMLADREVEALHKGRVDLPAAGRSHLLDGLQGSEDHPVAHPHQAPPAYGSGIDS
jgi:hypothetical protein